MTDFITNQYSDSELEFLEDAGLIEWADGEYYPVIKNYQYYEPDDETYQLFDEAWEIFKSIVWIRKSSKEIIGKDRRGNWEKSTDEFYLPRTQDNWKLRRLKEMTGVSFYHDSKPENILKWLNIRRQEQQRKEWEKSELEAWFPKVAKLLAETNLEEYKKSKLAKMNQLIDEDKKIEAFKTEVKSLLNDFKKNFKIVEIVQTRRSTRTFEWNSLSLEKDKVYNVGWAIYTTKRLENRTDLLRVSLGDDLSYLFDTLIEKLNQKGLSVFRR